MKRILITGSRGYLGSFLVPYLEKKIMKCRKFKYKFILKNFSFLKNDSSKSCYY